jgi:hypothetical protein
MIEVLDQVLDRFSTSAGERLRPIRVWVSCSKGEIRGCFSVQQELANPWRKTESAGKSSQRNPNRNAAADKGFIHEGQRPYAQAE